MAVHSLLITSANEDKMQLAHFAFAIAANHIDGRGLTQRYTVFGENLEGLIHWCREHNVTVQEIIGAGSTETYQLRHQGEAPAWQPNSK